MQVGGPCWSDLGENVEGFERFFRRGDGEDSGPTEMMRE